MSTFGTRLMALRKERKLTQKQLGKLVGVSDVTVGYWEKDQNSPGGLSLTKLASFFGVSENYLLTGKEELSNVSTGSLGAMQVPIISWVQAGQWTAECDASNLDGTTDYILTTDLHSIGTFALNVKGKSMEPEFKEGDTIVVDPDLYPVPGEYVIAANGRGEATFKKYRSRGVSESGEDVFELIPLNDDYAPLNSALEPISIIGVVVEHRRKMRR
ncbi:MULTISPECIES: LexA family protein [Serratia]|uniref:LexA family protein n=1 Tax=Serratia TaxID=613 RepID=UPI0013DA3499|nr:S24 family peptidase [Serratia marcescens]